MYRLHINDKKESILQEAFQYTSCDQDCAKVGANCRPIPNPSHCLYNLPLKMKNENFTAFIYL